LRRRRDVKQAPGKTFWGKTVQMFDAAGLAGDDAACKDQWIALLSVTNAESDHPCSNS
jgi:hypothetical protein